VVMRQRCSMESATLKVWSSMTTLRLKTTKLQQREMSISSRCTMLKLWTQLNQMACLVSVLK
jgi:hypothetical protein